MGLLDKYKQTVTMEDVNKLLSTAKDIHDESVEADQELKKYKDKLINEIIFSSQKYYTDGSSNISDTKFDMLLSELKLIDPSNPLITTVGHGYSVNKDTTYGQKKPHKYSFVGSLDKVHNWKELSSDLKSRNVVYSLKLDGISCVLYYVNGELDCALTRGDGKTGIDVTDKVLVIAPDVKTFITYDGQPFTGAVRGELLMSYENFNKYSQSHSEAKNPRNTTAGLINRKDVSEQDLRLISLVVYTVLASNVYFSSYLDVLYTLKGWHDTVPYDWSEHLEESAFDEYMGQLNNQFRQECDYPSDGIVIATDYIDMDIPHDNKANILTWYSQAYKFPAESKKTTVQKVEWNLSKTGYMIPKVKFNDIQLSGTSVQYATAFNAKYVKDNGIMNGTDITVTKSGEIIPYIVSVDSVPDGNVKLPETCPSCGSELEWEGVHLKCNNVRCPCQKMQDLVIWMKTIAPIDGLSDILIEKFANELQIEEVSELYTLSPSNVKVHFPNPGKQQQLFVDCVVRCLTADVDVSTAVKACNIPRFGEKTCQLCKDVYDTVMYVALSSDTSQEVRSKLEPVLGVANTSSILNNVGKLKNITYLSSVHCNHTSNVESKGDVCITGKLSVKRKDFEKELRQNGWNPVSSVKKDTKYLVTDNPNSGSSKNKSADKYGVPKITENEFRVKFL